MASTLATPLLLLGSLIAAAGGCSPEIGDECTTSADCSVNGDRICDISQSGGYCTVPNCDSDACPDEARCVDFRYEEDRHAATWCMASCEESDDCRTDEGYGCVHAEDLGADIARVIDSKSGRFCAQPVP